MTPEKPSNIVDIGPLMPCEYNVCVDDVLDLINEPDIIEYISNNLWSESFVDNLLGVLTEEQFSLLNRKLIKCEIYGRS